MAENKKPRALATQAAGKAGKFGKANLAATLRAKEEGKKVAYTYIANSQDEIIRAMDIVPAWGENFAGICGAKRDAERFLQKAESDNFSRSICTYATCTIGFDMWRQELGEIPPGTPWGGMGRPDMIIGSAQQLCDPRIKWPQATQHYLQDVPVWVGSMYYPPWDPNVDNKEQEKLYVKFATEELRSLVRFCEKHTGRKMDWDRFSAIVDLTDRTWDLFVDTYELRKAHPTPMDTGDAMNTMVPLTFNLGTQEAYDYYKELYDELKEKIAVKKGVAENEKYRLVWGAGLPSWFALGDFQYFNDKGAVFPADVTYRNAEKARASRPAQDERSPGACGMEVGALLDPLVRQGEIQARLRAEGGAHHRVPGRLRLRRRCLSFSLLMPELARGHCAAGRDPQEDIRRHTHPHNGRGHRRHQLLQ